MADDVLSIPPELESIVRLFPQLTGWELQCRSQEVDSGLVPLTVQSAHDSQPATREQLRIIDMWADQPPGKPCANRALSDEFVSALDSLYRQAADRQRSMEQLHAQLAANIEPSPIDNRGEILLSKLQSVIRKGLSALNMAAAGLYLLDDETRQLILRVHVGLDRERLLQNPRRLKDSLADLEALVGHAVTISAPKDGTGQQPLASGSNLSSPFLPESFPAGICVPVATHSTPLGTLWLFSDGPREFSPRDSAVAELIGGNLATELEKDAVAREGALGRKIGKDIQRAQVWQQLQTPPGAPELDQWSIAGNQFLSSGVGGAFYDFSVSPSGELIASVGDVQGAVFESGLAAATLRGALRSVGNVYDQPERLLTGVNNTMWNCPLGDQLASLLHLRIDERTGRSRWGNAGRTGAIILGTAAEAMIVHEGTPLGICEDEQFEQDERVLLPGSTFFAYSDGFRQLFRHRYGRFDEDLLLERATAEKLLMPDELDHWVRDLIGSYDSYRTEPDVAFFAVHRKPDE